MTFELLRTFGYLSGTIRQRLSPPGPAGFLDRGTIDQSERLNGEAICNLRCAITASVTLSLAWALASLATASLTRWVALASSALSASISCHRDD